MTDDDNRSNQKFELSTTQVAGSALAAMSGAFLASYLGTAGTIIGAVVGSLVATVGTAAYTWWLRRTSEVVKRTATQVRETGMGSTVVIPLLPGKGKPAGAGVDADAHSETDSADESDTDSTTEAQTETDTETDSDRWAWARNRPWGKVALAAAGVALAVVAGLTVVESITGKPLSSYTKGGDQTGSTVSNLGRNKPKPSPTPTTPSKTSSPIPTPTPSQGPVTPTPLPTETPTETPTGLPTETPTPTPSPSGGITATP